MLKKRQWMVLSFCAIGVSHAQNTLPSPFDEVFPSTEYLGPSLGLPNTDPIYPLTTYLWKTNPSLKQEDIRIYGWIEPSANLSTSTATNMPMTYSIVPNAIELQQGILRAEKQPNTIKTQQGDVGFRFTGLYGVDYRFTTAKNFFSQQLLNHNLLYGYDLPEAYVQLYSPFVAQGLLITAGRYLSPTDIESQFAPYNFLATHSVMYSYTILTLTGVNATLKLSPYLTLVGGINAGGDVAPWSGSAHPITGQFLVRLISKDNNDSLWGGINTLNLGQVKNDFDNLQQFNLTWTHRFSSTFFTLTEIYTLYQTNAYLGGSCIYGPQKPFSGNAGGGCGAYLPGQSTSLGFVNYIEYKVSDKQFVSFRTDLLNDMQGQSTGYKTKYLSLTLGLTQKINAFFELRPEIRVDTNFPRNVYAYDNGNTTKQFSFITDMIIRF